MDDPTLYATARKCQRKDMPPMVSAPSAIEFGRATELAHTHNQCVFEHAAIYQVTQTMPSRPGPVEEPTRS